MRSWRLLRVGVVLIGLAATLTACAPGRSPLLAVTLIGGYPVAILRTCTGGPAEVSVTENSQPPTDTPTASTEPSPTGTPSPTVTPTTESYIYFWSVKTTAADRIDIIPMFTTPTGWERDGNSLAKLLPDARYIADARVAGVADVSPVNFTVDDLHNLKDNEVLYGVNAPLTTVLTRQDFEDKSAQACLDETPATTSPQ